MSVKCLTIVVYETRWDWHLEKTFNPTWDEIVASIDRLDKFHYPWVWLFVGDETENSTVDCLTIMGGDGVYWLALSAGRYALRMINSPDRPTGTSLSAASTIRHSMPLRGRPQLP